MMLPAFLQAREEVVLSRMPIPNHSNVNPLMKSKLHCQFQVIYSTGVASWLAAQGF